MRVGALGRWMEQRRLRVEKIDERMIARFLRFRRQTRVIKQDGGSHRKFLQYLRESGVVAQAPRDDSDAARLERRFAEHLAQERGLSSSTIADYLFRTRRFVVWRYGTGPITLDELRADDAPCFISDFIKIGGAVNSKHMVTALRCFLRFLHLRGETSTDLSGSVPTVPYWPMAKLPRWLPDEHVEKILKTCDRRTAVGRRNHAVLLLLARLGLRPGEVVSMTLDDLDWESGALIIRGGKGIRKQRLPMPVDVGASLALYLRKNRPRCSTRRLFITMTAPHRGFNGIGAVGSIVNRAIARAGLRPPYRGPYVLRHSLATKMLRSGASLAEIGEILRHQKPDTTAIYAKVDLLSLRPLALPWPGSTEVAE